LMQDQGNGLQPIAYLSKKLHGAELNYPIHDKEALAIIIAFKTWRCFLEGRKTTVYTDQCSLKYLKTQPNISRWHVRWIDFLETHFQYDIVYKPGHKNEADALRINGNLGTQLPSFAPITTLRIPRCSICGTLQKQQNAHRYCKALLLAPHGRQRPAICHLVYDMSTDEEQQAETGRTATASSSPEKPWQVVRLDFITGLPTITGGHDAILVVIDKFSEM
ncbi:hypothetical protein CLOP_g19822, partial [Closterium sp. NIES-67]